MQPDSALATSFTVPLIENLFSVYCPADKEFSAAIMNLLTSNPVDFNSVIGAINNLSPLEGISFIFILIKSLRFTEKSAS